MRVSGDCLIVSHFGRYNQIMFNLERVAVGEINRFLNAKNALFLTSASTPCTACIYEFYRF